MRTRDDERDDEIRGAITSSRTMAEALRSLGLTGAGGNYRTLKRHIERLGLDASHLKRTDDDVRQAVIEAKTYADALRLLGLVPRGGNYATLRARVERLGIDTSHFVGMGWRRGETRPVVPARPLEEILIAGRPTASNLLKKRLIKEGMKLVRCESCLRRTWNKQPIPLELDHVNGDRNDNRLSNLRLLCPNCHAGTPTYRGLNRSVNKSGPRASQRLVG